jgi:hypothetical protein
VISIRIKLYLVIAAAFFVGVLGIRAKWINEGEARVRSQLADKRLRAIKEAEDVRNEVEAIDRGTLRDRGAVWVRGTKPKR